MYSPGSGTAKSFQLQDLINIDSESGADETPRLIDKKVSYWGDRWDGLSYWILVISIGYLGCLRSQTCLFL